MSMEKGFVEDAPALLHTDGHGSRSAPGLAEMLKLHNIVMVVRPSHVTHLIP